jgi:tetratricopeptide (TPR) repeat protein
MRKRIVLLIILLSLIHSNGLSQNLKVCTYYDYMTPTDFISTCGLKKQGQVAFNISIIDSFLLDSGLENNFVLKECPSLNTSTAAMIDPYYGTMERYVTFPENLLDNWKHYTSINWRYFGQLMHAIGHQLFRHTLIIGLDNSNEELIADEFSGYMLASMGASLKQSFSALQFFKSETLKHAIFPKVDVRKEAIAKGWDKFKSGISSQEFSLPFLPASMEIREEKIYAGMDFKERVLEYNRAGRAMNIGDYDNALLQYEDLVDNGINFLSKTNQQSIFRNLGFIYFAKKNETRALEYFNIALELDPRDMISLLKLIEIRKKRGEIEEALALLKKALKIRSRNATLYLDFGDTSLLHGDVKYAIVAYNRALILQPKLVNARINLAKIYIKEGNELTLMMRTRDPKERKKIDYKKFRNLREELYLKAMELLEEGLITNPESILLKRHLYKLYVSLDDKKYMRRMKKTMIAQ